MTAKPDSRHGHFSASATPPTRPRPNLRGVPIAEGVGARTDSGDITRLSTTDASLGMPAGPAGCRAGCVVLVIVALLIGAFIAAVWWALRDIGHA